MIDDFWWANDERIVVSMAERFGTRDEPVAIGQLHAIDADGKNPRLLASPYGMNDAVNATTLKAGLDPSVYMLDTLAEDPRNVLVSVVAPSSDPTIRIDKLDIYNHRRTPVATVPVRRADSSPITPGACVSPTGPTAAIPASSTTATTTTRRGG
ncbi:hypothetical protein GGR77_003560 [Xanthomonas translucens]